MNREATSRCESIRVSLHAYRAGDQSPLERERVRSHIAGCTSCGAELLLQSQVEDAAKYGPEPMSDDTKHAILARIKADVSAEAPGGASLLSWRLLLPSAALAAGLATVLLLSLIHI